MLPHDDPVAIRTEYRHPWFLVIRELALYPGRQSAHETVVHGDGIGRTPASLKDFYSARLHRPPVAMREKRSAGPMRGIGRTSVSARISRIETRPADSRCWVRESLEAPNAGWCRYKWTGQPDQLRVRGMRGAAGPAAGRPAGRAGAPDRALGRVGNERVAPPCATFSG